MHELTIYCEHDEAMLVEWEAIPAERTTGIPAHVHWEFVRGCMQGCEPDEEAVIAALSHAAVRKEDLV